MDDEVEVLVEVVAQERRPRLLEERLLMLLHVRRQVLCFFALRDVLDQKRGVLVARRAERVRPVRTVPEDRRRLRSRRRRSRRDGRVRGGSPTRIARRRRGIHIIERYKVADDPHSACEPGGLDRRLLGEAPDALCIFEHGRARRTDPFLEKAGFRVAFCGDEVYPFAAAGDDDLRIGDAIGATTTAYPPLVGALTHGDLSTRTDLGETALASIAAKTERIIVGAYDGEGYVIWRGR
jgi:hypothetical protein